MRSTLCIVVVSVLISPGVARAQGFEEAMAQAQRLIEAKEWVAALDRLVALPDLAESEGTLESLATRLEEVGTGLKGARDYASQLRAVEALLSLRRRLLGDRDHPDVARLLSELGSCLQSLGRQSEALQPLESCLAMRQRLAGDRDDPDVARSLNNLALGLDDLGRHAEALPKHEASLALRRRLYGDGDSRAVAIGLNNTALCIRSLGRPAEALPLFEASLAMRRRLAGAEDDAAVATCLHNIGLCLASLGRTADALSHYESALAMDRRLAGERDDRGVVIALDRIGRCLLLLGREGEALPRYEASLAMQQRLARGRDHPAVALGLNNVANCLESLGRALEALPLLESALAMWARLLGDRDHPHRATTLANTAACLVELGRAAEALPKFEAALAMQRRIYADADQPEVANALNSLAFGLQAIGDSATALPLFEASLAMRRRIHGDGDHASLATSLHNVAACLHRLDRLADALPYDEESLAMERRLHGDRDHPSVARQLHTLAAKLWCLGRVPESLARAEEALAMQRRLRGDRDHPDLARALDAVAYDLLSLHRADEALPHFEASLAMWRRLLGDRDHPGVANSLHQLAAGLVAVGRGTEALAPCEGAVAMIERLRDTSRIAADSRQSYFDSLKRFGAFERLQALYVRLGRAPAALEAAERGRGRGLLDLIEQQRFDAFAEAGRRATLRGDAAGAARLGALAAEIEAVELASDRLLHDLTRLDDLEASQEERGRRRQELLEQSDGVAGRRRRLLDERARRLGDVLPVGRVRTAAEIGAALRPGELLLEFTITRDVSLLYVLAHGAEIEAVELPTAFATVARVLPSVLSRMSHRQVDWRGLDAADGSAADAMVAKRLHELFASLMPAPVWERIRGARRVFVVPHRELHRLPFELLVTAIDDGDPVPWLDVGPEIAYVPSGSALVWLRQRAREARDDVTELDLLAVGDPRSLDEEPELPEGGVFVVAVAEGGEGARVGLQPGDVLSSYDGHELADDKGLRDARMRTEVAIEDGQRDGAPIPVRVWRRGAIQEVRVRPGRLGVEVAPGPAREGRQAILDQDSKTRGILRSGELERIGRLPPLQGARAETAAIEAVFEERDRVVRRLHGAEAAEPAVFDLAARSRYLHFACHGIAEELSGQSLSMLVLAQPQRVLPADDGLLKLGDLLNDWRGRLASCRLVTLSACRTNVGPTLRDEAPQALPIGFLFAGVPAVISSLWAVDDVSTRELMTDFYRRLLGGETDQLEAFVAAKKALRKRYPDPFHWAPFLYIGSPD